MKHFFRLLLTLSLLGSSLFVPAQIAQAATYPTIDLRNYLGGGGGSSDILLPTTCSLRQAIIAINNHSNYGACKADSTTKIILLPDAAITLTVQNKAGVDRSTTGDLNISTNMNILGTGSNSAVGWYDDGGLSEDRVFNIASGISVGMSGFRIFNGTAKYPFADSNDGGGIKMVGSMLSLNNMTLDNNYAYDGGGGIASFGSGSSLIMNVVNITNNKSATYSGGGVYHQGILRVENSYFYNNVSPAGGATLNYANLSKNVAGVINNTTFSDNQGIGISNSGSLILSYLTMIGNTENALYLNGNAWTYLRDSIILHAGALDCYNNGAYFVDGGYNFVFPAPSGSNTCDYNNGGIDDSIYHTVFIDPLLDGTAGVVGSNYTSVYAFDSTTSPVYNYHGVDASGVCVSPALPPNGNPYSLAIPALPGYDQYLGPRPTSAETDAQKGCDVGAYETGAYLAKPHIYMPMLRRFN